MTFSDYFKLEERFKGDTLNRCIDYDGQYGGQCWDLAQVYLVRYLGLPESILGGCGLVSNMLVPPKINELLEYFDEIDIHQMEKGDLVIWNYGHIAIFDIFDGNYCWFVTQNNPVEQLTTLSILSQEGSRAFRIKGVVPDPAPEPTPKPEPTPTPDPRRYVVKEGDTLWDICVWFYGDGTKYAEVATKNGIKDPNLIYPGQVIYL